jgi:hypothetical protein
MGFGNVLIYSYLQAMLLSRGVLGLTLFLHATVSFTVGWETTSPLKE